MSPTSSPLRKTKLDVFPDPLAPYPIINIDLPDNNVSIISVDSLAISLFFFNGPNIFVNGPCKYP